MRRVAALCAFLAPLLLGQDAALVDGVILNSATGQGIAGATVRLSAPKGNRYEAVTGDTGAFRIAGVQPADYHVVLDKTNYTTSNFTPWQAIHVGPGSIHLKFEMIPPGGLRGRVIGLDGAPAAGIEVTIEPYGGEAATTDAEGVFAFENLRPRAYQIMARVKQQRIVTTRDGARTATVPTYYPSVADPALAQSVTVRPGVDAGGYEVRLQTANVYKVRGTVVDPAGKPVAKAVVELLPRAAGNTLGFFAIGAGTQTFSIANAPLAGTGLLAVQSAPADPVVTGGDGVFEFPSVTEGDWVLRAESDTVHSDKLGRDVMLYGGVTVSVSRRALDDLQIPVAEPFDMPMTWEARGGPAPANPALTAMLYSEEGLRPAGGGRRAQDGSFRIEGITPGRYRIWPAVLFNSNYYAAAVLLGNEDVTRRAVQLGPFSDPIHIVLRPAAVIRGSVESGSGSRVLVVPASLAVGDPGQIVQVDSDGNFKVQGLPPGSYNVLASQRFDEIAVGDATYLRSVAPYATTVRVDEGASESVRLKLTNLP